MHCEKVALKRAGFFFFFLPFFSFFFGDLLTLRSFYDRLVEVLSATIDSLLLKILLSLF